jgi:hypothetical protein
MNDIRKEINRLIQPTDIQIIDSMHCQFANSVVRLFIKHFDVMAQDMENVRQKKKPI